MLTSSSPFTEVIEECILLSENAVTQSSWMRNLKTSNGRMLMSKIFNHTKDGLSSLEPIRRWVKLLQSPGCWVGAEFRVTFLRKEVRSLSLTVNSKVSGWETNGTPFLDCFSYEILEPCLPETQNITSKTAGLVSLSFPLRTFFTEDNSECKLDWKLLVWFDKHVFALCEEVSSLLTKIKLSLPRKNHLVPSRLTTNSVHQKYMGFDYKYYSENPKIWWITYQMPLTALDRRLFINNQ